MYNKEDKIKLYRHGEIVFEKINKLPTGLEESNTNLIVQGKTGNRHTFNGGSLFLEQKDEYVFGYFKANNTTLLHPEHGENGEAKLPNGVYRLRKQLEFINGELKPVID